MSPTIDTVREVLERAGLQPDVGPISTTFSGSADIDFSAVRDAFGRASSMGGVIMTVTISNACPT